MNYLIKTLYALAHNNYDLAKVEIIIADDGSSDGTKEELLKHSFPFSLKYVFQNDKGYRLAKIRNEGIKLASHDYIVILDCDMVPCKNFLLEHIHILSKDKKNVSLGHREFVFFRTVTIPFIKNNLSQIHSLPRVARRKAGSAEDWRLKLYKKTNHLKNCLELYWACSGGNLGIRKDLIIQAGMFDEDFTEWGREDNELGYRLHKLKAHFVPNLKAAGFHLDHPVDMKKINKSVEKMHTVFQRKILQWQEKMKPENNPYFQTELSFLEQKKNISFYYAFD